VAAGTLRAQAAIHAALAGAESTGFQAGVRLCGPALELAGAKQLQVCRFELFRQDNATFPATPHLLAAGGRGVYQLTATVFSR
jgi:hypothetical protein